MAETVEKAIFGTKDFTVLWLVCNRLAQVLGFIGSFFGFLSQSSYIPLQAKP